MVLKEDSAVKKRMILKKTEKKADKTKVAGREPNVTSSGRVIKPVVRLSYEK